MKNIFRKLKNIIEANLFFSKLLDIFFRSFFYKRFIEYKINRYIRTINKTKKYNVIIETSNFCNAKCIMCPHVFMKRQKGFMSDEIFDLIIDKLYKDSINPLAFILNGFGEPLTDKLIFERIKKIKQKFPNSVVKFYSNLGLANESMLQNLINSGLDELNISFNGYDKENYEKIMAINFEKTQENIGKLIELRKKFGSKLKIRMSMALVAFNDVVIDKFIKKWENIVDSVSVNKIHNYNNSVENVSGKNKIKFDNPIYPCKYLWNTMVFGNSGDMFLCCLDYEGKYVFGNIKDKSPLEIFYSERFEKIRKMHLDRNIEKFEICKNCYTPYKNGVEWIIDDLY